MDNAGNMQKMKYAIFGVDTVSLGIGYIISYLRKDGHDVKLIMETLLYQNDERIIRQVREYKPDVCLFSCLTVYYQWALRIAKKIKDEMVCKIIFGGLHVTCCPDVVRENKFIDDICIGCGIEYFGYKLNPDEVFPAREDFYKQLAPHHRRHPIITTSFSCPYDCSYCLTRKYRTNLPRRSVDGCIREAVELKRFGAKRFYIGDDCFTIDKKWLF